MTVNHSTRYWLVTGTNMTNCDNGIPVPSCYFFPLIFLVCCTLWICIAKLFSLTFVHFVFVYVICVFLYTIVNWIMRIKIYIIIGSPTTIYIFVNQISLKIFEIWKVPSHDRDGTSYHCLTSRLKLTKSLFTIYLALCIIRDVATVIMIWMH